MHATEDDKYLRKVCTDRGLYDTPRLNNVIFLNDCGLSRVPCLRNYVALKSVYLNGNRLTEIPHLSPLSNLQSLYLNNNMIEEMHHLDLCPTLQIVDLSRNRISVLKGITRLAKLTNLNLQGNIIGKLDHNALAELKSCSSLTNLDISLNIIKEVSSDANICDGKETLLSVLVDAIPQIKCLCTDGNPMVIESTRDVLNSFPNLVFLNSHPMPRGLCSAASNSEDPCRRDLLTHRRKTAIQRMNNSFCENGSENYDPEA